MNTTPDRLNLPLGAPADFWPAWADAVAAWLARRDVPARDAIVLLPHAGLLGPARQALARRGGWLPRVETSHSLAAALPPRAREAVPDEPTGHATVDRLLADRLLRRQGWAQAWARRDPGGFDQAVSRTVQTTHQLMHGAQALPPRSRPAWWQRVRDALAVPAGPGATERALARVALEWSTLADAPATDALFDLQPAAWIALVAGGADPLTDALLADAAGRGVAACRIVVDAPADTDPFGPDAGPAWPEPAPVLWLADDAEDEALAAAGAVLQALAAGSRQVALVAEDRLLTRRVRALLDRRDVAILDETGWTLATTRAGARVMVLLRAARPGATADDRLDWLKSDPDTAADHALTVLERHWRRPARDALGEDAAALWQRASARLATLASPSRRTLADWLAALAATLPASDDPAAVAVRQALDPSPARAAAQGGWGAQVMSLHDFIAWCDGVLEQGSYTPPAPAGGAQVVITPMARALLRPFDTVVLPGADALHLDAPSPVGGLLSDAERRAIGLPDLAQRSARRAQVLAHLARAPGLVLLRRHRQDDEPLAPSALVDWLALARAAAGASPLVSRPVEPATLPRQACPVPRPQPRAEALPASLSATQVESLRQCPYQFFARVLLRLDEDEELERDPDKRDFGNWLHDTLERYHRARRDAPESPHDPQALRAAAEEAGREMGLDAAAWWPFLAGLDDFVRRYLAWLTAREAAGWRFADGEVSRRMRPPELEGTELHGRLDRIDRNPHGDLALLDYKTSRLDQLKRRANAGLEDTQLPFYAALVDDAAVTEAAYVALDERTGIGLAPHKQVVHSAQALLQGLGQDLRRLREGEPLRALGEGPVCDACAARGLCRRDFWATGPLQERP
jgi:ATP-dependent helicase/nuclease subunit B